MTFDALVDYWPMSCKREKQIEILAQRSAGDANDFSRRPRRPRSKLSSVAQTQVHLPFVMPSNAPTKHLTLSN